MPFLAFATCREIIEKMPAEGRPTYAQAIKNYRSSLESGILKIMSKMGISVLASYRGAQIFECVGLASGLVEKCFTGTSTQIEGIGFAGIAEESLRRHALAYAMPGADGHPQAGGVDQSGRLPVPSQRPRPTRSRRR